LLVQRSEVERTQSDCVRARKEVKALPGGYSIERWTDSRSGAALARRCDDRRSQRGQRFERCGALLSWRRQPAIYRPHIVRLRRELSA